MTDMHPAYFIVIVCGIMVVATIIGMFVDSIKNQKEAKRMDDIFYGLLAWAKNALAIHSRDLTHEAYGAAKMALDLGAITKEQFYTLKTLLVTNGLKNPRSGLV